MGQPQAFDFSGEQVAAAYDEVLVPVLFEAWAERLIEEHQPWAGLCVLDLAAGTGVVTRRLAEQVGPAAAGGRVISADLNAEMLAVAEQRSTRHASVIEFVQTPASPLNLPEACVDRAICQQGFQFFPDRRAAAAELARVVRPGGLVHISAWLPVEELPYFRAICAALEEVGEPELSALMRLPFDHLPAAELTACFESAGFEQVRCRREERDLVFARGLPAALEFAYATPIRPRLLALSEPRQAGFQSALSLHLSELMGEGGSAGPMVTHVLTARRSD